MRNDGTEEQPKWVCNNPKCVKYVPPEPAPEPTPAPEDNGEEDNEEAE
jgi:hypothetical protein